MTFKQGLLISLFIIEYLIFKIKYKKLKKTGENIFPRFSGYSIPSSFGSTPGKHTPN